MKNNHKSKCRFLAVIALMVVLVGCNQPKTATVRGKVTFDGKPLPSGKVVFLCKGGNKPVLSYEIRDGEYVIEGAPIGSAAVTVATYELKCSPVPNSPVGPTRPGGGERDGGVYMPIPKRYGNPGQSGLQLEVSEPEQTHDLQLTP